MASAEEPPNKIPKKDPVVLIRQAWECYRNFLDAESDPDEPREGDEDEDQDGGAIDEMLDLIDILKPLKVKPFDRPFIPETMENINIISLLPILISMAYVHLANYAEKHVPVRSNEADRLAHDAVLGFDSPMEYFENAIKFWPTNPAAICLVSNFDRINCLSRTDEICDKYENAAEFAMEWRKVVSDYLDGPEEVEAEVEGMNVKEWVELLMANGAVGMEYVPGDETNCTSGEYSYSEIEATSSFMLALLLSSLGKQEKALQYLKRFSLSHRIHPNVWKLAQSPRPEVTEDKAIKKEDAILFPPHIYHVKGGKTSDMDQYSPKGILPPNLYQRMCQVFAPKAEYWQESDYDSRGYYSYFIDLDGNSNGKSVREKPTNLIEDVIVNHLLPLAEKTLEGQQKSIESEPTRIVGAEWWRHTRQLGANLGHQIHFDTDESLLGQEKKVTHPIISSVLYLTGAMEGSTETARAGATIVFNQTPDSKEVASKAWVSHAKDNSFMTFPGNLLHGVLPCRGPNDPKTHLEYSQQELSRLTFMVGFWTRNVTEGMDEDRELYGPCGRLPPATKEHSWVIEIQKGYEGSNGEAALSKLTCDYNQDELACHVLPFASPAWEEFTSSAKSCTRDDPSVLVVPKGLDHRYFVLNAPHCFRDSLFEDGDRFE